MEEYRLKDYYAKRNFTKTPEPRGGEINDHQYFVIHKHNSSHLHYDLRLAVNGVLKSWAIPKGMPKAFSIKHLAIQTEDHPLEYLTFSGAIPRGEYGAGTVKIWDIGKYIQINTKDKSKQLDMNQAIINGHVNFLLIGKRHKNQYTLIKINPQGNNNQWLIFKSKKA